MRPALVVLTLLLGPRAAAACATCLSSPYGDRTYNWGFLGLFLMPFVVAAVIGGVLARAFFSARGKGHGPANRHREETT